MDKERYIRIGSIAVRSTDEAAFLKFCLHQLIDDDKWIFGIDNGKECRCEFGIVAQEEDLPKVRRILDILDSMDIYYETSFDLPTE